MTPQDRAFLASMFNAAVAAADPRKALAAHLPARPKGRTIVIGAGKGAAQLAAAFEDLWQAPIEGVVVTRYGYACPTRHIRVLEAPAEGLTLADEVALNETLLASGAPIGAMNAIRKQFSRIKGGRLAMAAHPARVVSLIVSDVPGDDPAQVASGPTVADRVDRARARAALRDHGIVLPERLARFLDQTAEDAPLPDDPKLAGNEVHVVASAARSLEAAATVAESAGVAAVILSDAIEGEARDVARMHAAMAREVASRGRPFAPPVVMLSGGETTVTIRDKAGRGGRNTEFLLSFALAVEGCAGISALAADTDGIDGSEDNAGAFADGHTAARMRAAGHDPAMTLAAHDAWSAFEAIDQLFVTGPTGTNVNDLRAILIRG